MNSVYKSMSLKSKILTEGLWKLKKQSFFAKQSFALKSEILKANTNFPYILLKTIIAQQKKVKLYYHENHIFHKDYFTDLSQIIKF